MKLNRMKLNQAKGFGTAVVVEVAMGQVALVVAHLRLWAPLLVLASVVLTYTTRLLVEM